MMCPNCGKNPAILKDFMAAKNMPFPCEECQDKHKKMPKLSHVKYEFISQEIKDGRRIYQKELTQPFREDQFSKEFRDYYPEQSKKMVESGAITKEQYDNAKPVWGNDVF